MLQRFPSKRTINHALQINPSIITNVPHLEPILRQQVMIDQDQLCGDERIYKRKYSQSVGRSKSRQ